MRYAARALITPSSAMTLRMLAAERSERSPCTGTERGPKCVTLMIMQPVPNLKL